MVNEIKKSRFGGEHGILRSMSLKMTRWSGSTCLRRAKREARVARAINLVCSVVAYTHTAPLAMEVDIEDAMGISPVHFLAGAVAGTAEHCGMYPIDTIKVRPLSLSASSFGW